MFRNRKIAIATQHCKEVVMAPLLREKLGMQCLVPENLNTDALGTFTGEIERKDDPITTLRAKCRMALTATGLDLVVASEGSFGPHPSLAFSHSGEELVMLLDVKNNLEIIGHDLSVETNFAGREIDSEKALTDFANSVGFPEHALIFRNAKGAKDYLVKGISDVGIMKKVFRNLSDTYKTAYVETDMRAMYNPTRMKAIGRATENMIKKALSLCPQCKTPGFSVVEARKGLPCGWCGLPTQSVRAYVHKCRACGSAEIAEYPHEKLTKDPMYCDGCNP